MVQDHYENKADMKEKLPLPECLRRVVQYFIINKGKTHIKRAKEMKASGLAKEASQAKLCKEAGVEVAWLKGWK